MKEGTREAPNGLNSAVSGAFRPRNVLNVTRHRGIVTGVIGCWLLFVFLYSEQKALGVDPTGAENERACCSLCHVFPSAEIVSRYCFYGSIGLLSVH